MAWGFFNRQKDDSPDPHGIEAARAHFMGGFRLVYERKELPGYGSVQQYALESYGLPPFPPSGPSITIREPLGPGTSAPLYTLQSVPLAGIPTQAGMLYGAPLFDPNLPGFVGTAPTNRTFVPNVVDPTRRHDNRLG